MTLLAVKQHVKTRHPAPVANDTFETVESSLAETKRLIEWLFYVNEWEYTKGEREQLINAAQRFAKVAQPIANKYMD